MLVARERRRTLLPLTFYRRVCILPRMSTKEQRERIELLQGTLDMLILRTLILGPTHGHAVAKAIEFKSDDVLQVEQGSLYPALHRLIKRGWITAEEDTSENNRRAKFYRLTAKGRKQLAVETSKWDKLAGAIARIVRPSEQEGKS
jgi:PadR family transcriptional regulator PadR